MVEAERVFEGKDLLQINAEESIELDFWCDKFNCNEKQIWAAISIVGCSSMKVEKFLRFSNQIA